MKLSAVMSKWDYGLNDMKTENSSEFSKIENCSRKICKVKNITNFLLIRKVTKEESIGKHYLN